MVQLKLKLKAKTKLQDPASAGMRWLLGDDAVLRIRKISLHSEMALRMRSAFVQTQHINGNTRSSTLDSKKCELRLWVSQGRICDDVAVSLPMWGGLIQGFGLPRAYPLVPCLVL